MDCGHDDEPNSQKRKRGHQHQQREEQGATERTEFRAQDRP